MINASVVSPEKFSTSQFDVKAFLERWYRLNRSAVSSEANQVVEYLHQLFPDATLLGARSGEECLSWVIPKGWRVNHARLMGSDGHIIADFHDQPLHVMQYSDSFEGCITYEQLKEHVYTDPDRPDRIPYIYRKQYQFNRNDSWGMCLPYAVFSALDKQDMYHVVIDTDFYEEEMLVLDYELPGESEDTVFFAAHNCHPAQVNDGLAGVGILVRLFQWLASLKKRTYTYRLIIGPEYFAAPVVLSKAKHIKRLRSGYYLDMMATRGRLTFSQSYRGCSKADYISRQCFEKMGLCDSARSYRGVWGNDEMFYDGPDFEIPTVCLGREDFSEYHTDGDNMDAFSLEAAEESYCMLKHIVETHENDRVFKRNYQGPLYLSRYDLYIDPKLNRGGARDLLKIQRAMNGRSSIVDIALETGVDSQTVCAFIDGLAKHKLVQELSESTE